MIIRRAMLSFTSLSFTVLLTACSSSVRKNTRSCDTPGKQQVCECSDGRKGVQVCLEDKTWGTCECQGTEDNTDSYSDTGPTSGVEEFIPPPEQCPEGFFEFRLQNIWSSNVNPTLDMFDRPPSSIVITVDADFTKYYGAKLDGYECSFYKACLPVGVEKIQMNPMGSDSICVDGTDRQSGKLDISSVSIGNDVVTMTYEGKNLSSDYKEPYESIPTGEGHFVLTTETEVADTENNNPESEPGDCTSHDDHVVLHIRWPWGDPAKTGLAGSACEDEKAGIHTPPYPDVVKIDLLEGACSGYGLAFLERQDQLCPWYKLVVPKKQWQGEIRISYPDAMANLASAAIELPQPKEGEELWDELWLVYDGAPDDESNPALGNCMNWSQRSNVFHFYTKNLGPGYSECGGQAVPTDNCAEIKPIDHSLVHFRYIWAGQKTFTYFPKEGFMPSWIVLEVNGGGGNKDVICVQEGRSPWFRCPVPNSEFFEGAKWRAVDKTHNPEWNTVAPRSDFPSAPGTYWLRWYYGKPDIPELARWEFTDYYPDGVEYALAGGWDGDDFCFSEDNVDRPPIRSDGYFPWDETLYEYPHGQSIAKYYGSQDKYVLIQDLLNHIVYERYLIWKDNYVIEHGINGGEACSEESARIKTDPPETVSEGQGYGMAIAAIIGDRDMFRKLWKFTRQYLSQSANKYCGGLMGWLWKGPEDCQPLDEPCDVEKGQQCGGDGDSAFDGDVDIAIGLVYAAWQWPEEFTTDAVNWILKMECEINTQYDGKWYYPTPGDTWDKNCSNYPNEPCNYSKDQEGMVYMAYYPPGFFRVFGEFLFAKLDPNSYTSSDKRAHLDFWYKTAEATYELVERCYNDVHPALFETKGTYSAPCSMADSNYDWPRALFRFAVDAAWYGNDTTLPENAPNSSTKYPGKSRMQAKMDVVQDFFANEFPANNPPEKNANRFSALCDRLDPSGTTSGCDPAYGHNSIFVNSPLSTFASFFDNDGKTTNDIRIEALEESVSASIMNDRYYQESFGVYSLLFLTGNMPKPFAKIEDETLSSSEVSSAR